MNSKLGPQMMIPPWLLGQLIKSQGPEALSPFAMLAKHGPGMGPLQGVIPSAIGLGGPEALGALPWLLGKLT